MWMIRPEAPGDLPAIAPLITAAFADAPHAAGTEATIVAGLRDAGALAVALVAEDDARIVGHVAFSPVAIDGQHLGWFGLGPVAVTPTRQREGIGAALVEAGLAALRALDAHGCVVLGDPAYYARFGFAADPRLSYPDAPAEYFQSLAFDGDQIPGIVTYHPAFTVE